MLSLRALLVVTKLLLVACEQVLSTSNLADSLALARFALGSLALIGDANRFPK